MAVVERIGVTAGDLALLAVGELVLDRKAGTLSGPSGSVKVRPAVLVLAARLMRRPGALVSNDKLLEAMYGDADDEPENSLVILRMRIVELRFLLRVLSGAKLWIRNEPLVGYSVEEKRATLKMGRDEEGGLSDPSPET